MISFTAAQEAALVPRIPNVGIFFHLAVPGDPARLWGGCGPCPAGISAVDPAGATYEGVGEIVDVPVIEQLINGIADRASFRLSGVAPRALAIAASKAGATLGSDVFLGIGIFDADWQLQGAPIWMFSGVADVLTTGQEPAPGDGPILRSIELQVGTGMTGRRRPGFAFLTNEGQQRRSPGDRICERTVLYSSTYEKSWPKLT